MSMKNKRGGEDIMIFWQFLMWLLIGMGIVIGVVSFYASQIDVRAMEAEILSKRVAECLMDGDGFFRTEYFNDVVDLNNGVKENKAPKFLNDCKLDGKIEGSDRFYIMANFTRIEDISGGNWKVSKQLNIGNKDLIFQCDVKRKGMEAQKFGNCVQRSIYGFYSDDNDVDKRKEAIVQLFVGSNNR